MRLNSFPFMVKGFEDLGHYHIWAAFPTINYCLPSWYNKYIKIDNKILYDPKTPRKSLNFNGQLFKEDSNVISWNDLKLIFVLRKK